VRLRTRLQTVAGLCVGDETGAGTTAFFSYDGPGGVVPHSMLATEWTDGLQ